MNQIHKFLTLCQEEYHKGTPLITDAEFDSLADKYNFNQVGYSPPSEKRVKLPFQMYSLQKFYDDETYPPSWLEGHELVESPKLDGAAISLLYLDGILVEVATRGDGEVGEDITANVVASGMVPLKIRRKEMMQITGEVVAPKRIPNARNYASGALHLKDRAEFKTRELDFIAYGVFPYIHELYTKDMEELSSMGFATVIDSDWNQYDQDGKVFRLNWNQDFEKAGYTAKHPRGAFALKTRSDVETKETKLLDVTWQVGSGGKVTPVATFEPIVIDGATLQRATLHNAGFLEALDVEIGDTLLVTRSGGIIPKVIGKL